MRILASIAGVAAVLAFRWASAEPDHRTRVVEATPDAILSVIENDARAGGLQHVSTSDQGEIYEQTVPVAILRSEPDLRMFADEGDLKVRLAVDRPDRAAFTFASSGSKTRLTFGFELEPAADGRTTQVRFRIWEAVAADGTPIREPNDIERYPRVNALAKRTLRAIDGLRS